PCPRSLIREASGPGQLPAARPHELAAALLQFRADDKLGMLLIRSGCGMSLAEKSFEPDAACPLDGIRVIDLSRLVAGNAVSSQLADFGAEVLKIEDPQKGDPLRAAQTKGVSVHWKLYARNKKSVALSPRDRRGRDLLLDLIASSEVLMENFRPGTLEK